jgi:thioredoxin 1
MIVPGPGPRRSWNTTAGPALSIPVGNLQHFEGDSFDQDVLGSSVPVLVDFYADWCGPCRAMAPAVELIADELAGQVKVGKLDVDASQDIAMRYGVMGIPTLGLFRDGQLVDRMVGYPGGAAPIRAWIARTVNAAV